MTVTCWVAVALLPDVSTAVQVTVVIPSGKVAGASFVTFAMATSSLAVAIPMATVLAVLVPGSVLTATSGGPVIVGGVVSTTVNMAHVFVVRHDRPPKEMTMVVLPGARAVARPF